MYIDHNDGETYILLTVDLTQGLHHINTHYQIAFYIYCQFCLIDFMSETDSPACVNRWCSPALLCTLSEINELDEH